jgi:mRNA-degrading endonuclease RelE of RelBE toxin-antitoxin system
MTEWSYIETEYFIRSCEKNNVSQFVKDSIREWSKSVRLQPTPSNKRLFISFNNIFQIWDARIPNPDANKGKSGGYRLIYYVNNLDKNLFVDLMENRDNLDYKGSKGKRQKYWDEHFVGLRRELSKRYEDC